MDLSAFGFDIAEGVSDPYLPGDYGIFVSKVDKGSIAEGRLRWVNSVFSVSRSALVCVSNQRLFIPQSE